MYKARVACVSRYPADLLPALSRVKLPTRPDTKPHRTRPSVPDVSQRCQRLRTRPPYAENEIIHKPKAALVIAPFPGDLLKSRACIPYFLEKTGTIGKSGLQ